MWRVKSAPERQKLLAKNRSVDPFLLHTGHVQHVHSFAHLHPDKFDCAVKINPYAHVQQNLYKTINNHLIVVRL